MGGKNPAIVTAAADLDAAADGTSRRRSGSCSRAIVLDAVHDDLVERLRERTEQLTSATRPTPTRTPAR
jgi:1-pyrroline-5-carboxylate dehydrogenase